MFQIKKKILAEITETMTQIHEDSGILLRSLKKEQNKFLISELILSKLIS